MDLHPSDTAADGHSAAATPSVGSDAAVPDPAALLSDPGADGERPPVRDPAAPVPPSVADGDGHTTGSEPRPNPAASETELKERASPAALPSDTTDEALSIPEDTGDAAVSLEDESTADTILLVPTVSVREPFNTPAPLSPVVADGPTDLALRSAPPPAPAKPEPSFEQDRSSSAMGGVSVPGRPSASPGFRPYSETPVYSDSGPAQSPPPPETPPPDQPCSGDWHHKTVDDLIAMGVPDVRIPRCATTWGACEIRGSLRSLGLEQYAEAMLNNGICGRRLCLLTASNLPRIGITDWEHIRLITASVRSLLSVADYVPYERQLDRPPPGPMTRALYLQCARPTGPPPPSSGSYRQFLRQHGFLDVLLELTNRPVVELPQPQPPALYREIAGPPVPSITGTPVSTQSQNASPVP